MKRIMLIFAISLFSSTTVLSQGAHDLSKFHHPKSSLKTHNYDSLFENSVNFKESAEAQELYESCLARYGGREKLAQRISYRVSYEMTPTSAEKSLKVTKSIASGRRYKIEKWNHHGYETRTLNKSQACYAGMDTTIALVTGRHKAETFSYLTLTMPLGLETENFTAVHYGGRENDSLGYFYMKLADSLMIVIGVHPTDKTIRSSEGIIYQDGKKINFVNFFSDFEDYDGYLFAQKMTNISMGLEVAQSILQKVEINPTLTDDDFDVTGGLSKSTEATSH